MQIDRDVQEVSRLMDNFDMKAMRELAEQFGGTYEPQAAATAAATASSSSVVTTTEPAPATGN